MVDFADNLPKHVDGLLAVVMPEFDCNPHTINVAANDPARQQIAKTHDLVGVLWLAEAP
jgi:hypothetical protein